MYCKFEAKSLSVGYSQVFCSFTKPVCENMFACMTCSVFLTFSCLLLFSSCLRFTINSLYATYRVGIRSTTSWHLHAWHNALITRQRTAMTRRLITPIHDLAPASTPRSENTAHTRVGMHSTTAWVISELKISIAPKSMKESAGCVIHNT